MPKKKSRVYRSIEVTVLGISAPQYEQTNQAQKVFQQSKRQQHETTTHKTYTLAPYEKQKA